MSINKWSDEEVLARTIWGEARGETIEGKEAVALVIVNRYKAKKWYTGYVLEGERKVPSLKETCLKKAQFSCWNKKDVNYQKILNLDTKNIDFKSCLEVAKKVLNGELQDFTNNATYYHTKNIKPKWAEHHSPCYEVGSHLFYNDIK